MTLWLSRIVVTLFLCWLTYLTWTNNVDLLSWATKKSKDLLPIKEEESSSEQVRQLRRDAYTRVSLVVHSWKNVYFSLHPKGINVGADAADTKGKNVWEILATTDLPSYSKENWVKFYPLFNEHLENVRRDLHEAQAAYPDILDPSTRSLIEQTRTQLTADRTVYYHLPRGGLGEHTPSSFQALFAEVFRTLGKLDEQVQRLRDELKS